MWPHGRDFGFSRSSLCKQNPHVGSASAMLQKSNIESKNKHMTVVHLVISFHLWNETLPNKLPGQHYPLVNLVSNSNTTHKSILPISSLTNLTLTADFHIFSQVPLSSSKTKESFYLSLKFNFIVRSYYLVNLL